MNDTRYRVRKGFGGKCILQKQFNQPAFICGAFDDSFRDIFWADVDFEDSPTELREVKYHD